MKRGTSTHKYPPQAFPLSTAGPRASPGGFQAPLPHFPSFSHVFRFSLSTWAVPVLWVLFTTCLLSLLLKKLQTAFWIPYLYPSQPNFLKELPILTISISSPTLSTLPSANCLHHIRTAALAKPVSALMLKVHLLFSSLLSRLILL